MRHITNSARGLTPARFENYCSLAIARSTQLRSSNKISDIFSTSITEIVSKTLLEHFASYPVGSNGYERLHTNAFGPIGTLDGEFKRIYAMLSKEEYDELMAFPFL
jgi:hypothetical protein